MWPRTLPRCISKPLEDNLCTMQFSCPRDLERVIEDRPWTFRDNTVHLAPYDCFAKPSTIKFDTLEIWVQNHNLLDGYFLLLKYLKRKLGEFVCVECRISKETSFEAGLGLMSIHH